MKILITGIKVDQRLQHRLNDAKYVADIIEYLNDNPNKSMQPIGLIHEGDTYWLWNGFHRLEAHSRAGRLSIDAEILEGNFDAAFDLSLGANGDDEHGRLRSPAEIEGIIRKVLKSKRHKEKGCREIAQLVNCGKTTVAKYRAMILGPQSDDEAMAEEEASAAETEANGAEKADAQKARASEKPEEQAKGTEKSDADEKPETDDERIVRNDRFMKVCRTSLSALTRGLNGLGYLESMRQHVEIIKSRLDD